MNLSDLRKSYERGSLDEADAGGAPLALFQRWLAQAVAAKVPEPNAMTLATVGPDGRPSTRIVLIKDADEQGLVFYTNYGSRKGRELAANPQAALQFHWVELERVVRVEGRVEQTTAPNRTPTSHPTAGLADRRVGLPAERGDQLASSAAGQRGQGVGEVRAAPAAAGTLGRLPPGAGRLGVLAGTQEPPARPGQVPPGSGHMAPGAASTVAVPATSRIVYLTRSAIRHVTGGAGRPWQYPWGE